MIITPLIITKMLNLNKNKLNYLYLNFFIIFIFSVIYWLYGTDEHFVFKPHFSVNHNITYMTALYYSLVTHSTVGFGDITPKSTFIKIITMIHIIIIILFLSLLFFK